MNQPSAESTYQPVSGLVEMEAEPPPPRRSWMTTIVSVVCVVVFLGLNAENAPESWDAFRRWGASPSTDIWSGRLWSLVTSAFVHQNLVHLLLNLGCLWWIGPKLERAIGSWRWLALFVTSAILSSTCELAFSDSTGIGASGVLYAFFGFIWVSRKHIESFRRELTPADIQWMFLWLLGCIAVTFMDVVRVGNASHVSGLVFGAAVAIAFIPRPVPVRIIGLCLLFVSSLIPLVWCPWSATWLRVQAYSSIQKADYPATIAWCDRVLAQAPQDAWAYAIRASAMQGLGRDEQALKDYAQATALDPGNYPALDPQNEAAPQGEL